MLGTLSCGSLASVTVSVQYHKDDVPFTRSLRALAPHIELKETACDSFFLDTTKMGVRGRALLPWLTRVNMSTTRASVTSDSYDTLRPEGLRTEKKIEKNRDETATPQESL